MTCDHCQDLGILTQFEGDLFVGEEDCLCLDDICRCEGCEREREREEEFWNDE